MPPVLAAIGAVFSFIGTTTFAVLTTVGLGVGVAGTIANMVLLASVVKVVSAGIGLLGLGPKPPKVSQAQLDRLKASLDPRAFRKIVFGKTASAIDVHYQEFTGTNQNRLQSVIVLASHAIHAIDEVWFDETKVISGVSLVDAATSSYLTFATRNEGTTANAVTLTGSSSWVSSTCRLVGLAYLWLSYDTGDKDSPFGQNITDRITVRVRGARMYDPRLDSSIGGSGPHRATDQTTWAWESDDVGRNPALQLLWYLLGWKIQNPSTSAWKLAVGLGIPVARIDLPSFIAAANICDEAVTLAAGGTEPRYRSDGVFSEGDDPSDVIDSLKAAMNGVLRDAGGKLALDILHNDLGSPVVDLTAADVIGEFTWMQNPPIDQLFNSVRGRYVNASDAGLYQMVDYPDVTMSSVDGIDRAKSFDMPMVQSASQAQRIAKTFLQRAQYPGTFTADFLASAWRCQVGSVIRLTFPALGFSNKLFRVVEHSIRFDGICPMVLREENANIYAWTTADETAAISAATPIRYDPLNGAIPRAVDDVTLIVDAGMNTDGTIKDDKVATTAIIDFAVTDSYIVTQVGTTTLTTNGQTATLISQGVSMAAGDTLMVTANVTVNGTTAGGSWTIDYNGTANVAAGLDLVAHTTSAVYSYHAGSAETPTITITATNTDATSRTFSDARLNIQKVKR